MSNSGAQNAMIFFLIFVALTLAITWWAARRTQSANEFFAAGHRITTT